MTSSSSSAAAAVGITNHQWQKNATCMHACMHVDTLIQLLSLRDDHAKYSSITAFSFSASSSSSSSSLATKSGGGGGDNGIRVAADDDDDGDFVLVNNNNNKGKISGSYSPSPGAGGRRDAADALEYAQRAQLHAWIHKMV